MVLENADNEINVSSESGLYDLSVTNTSVDGQEVVVENVDVNSIKVTENNEIEADNITSECTHSFTATVTAPTCTQQGYTAYTCVTCGYSYVDNYVSATGHSYDSNGQYCTVCGAVNPDYVAPVVTNNTANTTSNPANSNAVTSATDTTTPTDTTSVTNPKKTKIKKLKKAKKSVKVTWKKVSGVTGYQVQVVTNKKFTKNKKRPSP